MVAVGGVAVEFVAEPVELHVAFAAAEQEVG